MSDYRLIGIAGTPANVDAIEIPNVIKLSVPTMFTKNTHRPIDAARGSLSFDWTN